MKIGRNYDYIYSFIIYLYNYFETKIENHKVGMWPYKCQQGRKTQLSYGLWGHNGIETIDIWSEVKLHVIPCSHIQGFYLLLIHVAFKIQLWS